MAQYAVLIYADDSAHRAGETAASSDDIQACDDHAAELTAQAVMTAAWALTPRDEARSVRASGVTEGPFRGEGPVVAGFYILEAPDLDAALATAATNPVVRAGGGLEVRPVHSGGLVEPDEG